MSGLIAGGIFIGTIAQKFDSSSDSSPQAKTTAPKSTSNSSTSTNTQSKNTKFTAAQISSHSKRSDCWLIIDGSVYDVTDYLNQHPGGISQVTPFCGKDATEVYANKGGSGAHSSNADAIKQDYLVGVLSN